MDMEDARRDCMLGVIIYRSYAEEAAASKMTSDLLKQFGVI